VNVPHRSANPGAGPRVDNAYHNCPIMAIVYDWVAEVIANATCAKKAGPAGVALVRKGGAAVSFFGYCMPRATTLYHGLR